MIDGGLAQRRLRDRFPTWHRRQGMKNESRRAPVACRNAFLAGIRLLDNSRSRAFSILGEWASRVDRPICGAYRPRDSSGLRSTWPAALRLATKEAWWTSKRGTQIKSTQVGMDATIENTAHSNAPATPSDGSHDAQFAIRQSRV